MAEEEEKKTEKEEQEEEDASQKKGFPVKIIIVLVLVLVLFGGGFFAWKGRVLSKSSGGEETPRLTDIDEDSKEDIGPIYSMDTFIVNLVGGRGKHYLKAKIDLELDNEKVREEIDKRLPQFRDSMLTLLSSKSNDEINTPEGKYQLRTEIVSSLNQYLKTGKVKNIYFTDFIVQ